MIHPRFIDLTFKPILWHIMCRYAALKKVIYDLEKGQTQDPNGTDHHERSSLLEDGRHVDTVEAFVPLLDRELGKIVLFYKSQETELRGELNILATDIATAEAQGVARDEGEEEEAVDSDDEETSNWGMSSTRRKRSLSTNVRTHLRTISSGSSSFSFSSRFTG